MVSLARRAGHLEGYQSGYREGYRLGGYQALLERIAGPALPSYDLKVVYIPQGFESIDDGIISGLRAMVRELIIGTPGSITELALREQPDVVLILNGLHVFPDHFELQMQQLRERGIRTAIWFVDDPYFTEDTSRLCLHFDYVFTHELSCVELYRQRGPGRSITCPLPCIPSCSARCMPVQRINPIFASSATPFVIGQPCLMRSLLFLKGRKCGSSGVLAAAGAL